jgi:hypothetical protein
MSEWLVANVCVRASPITIGARIDTHPFRAEQDRALLRGEYHQSSNVSYTSRH